MEKMNPYEVSPAVRRDGRKVTGFCMRCGSNLLERTDPRFPGYNLICWIVFGWIVLIFRYAFLMPFDTCRGCGNRFHFKPLGSLLMMISLITAIPYIGALLLN